MADYDKTIIPFDKKIAVLCGGMSSERDVSLRSGKNCYEALIRLGYKNTVLIDVDSNITEQLKENQIDIAYIALHGKYGEDGCIQGLLEILNIPYTGCGVAASAISMNKDTTKRVLSTNPNLPLINSQVINEKDIKNFKLTLDYPVMIKPVCEGSSIGMNKAENDIELNSALQEAFKYNNSVLIEEFIDGLSATVGVLDIDNTTVATPVLAFHTKTEWYDFTAKYTQGMTQFELPAKLSEELTKKIKATAIEAHNTVNAKGVSRVDFLITKEKFYILEINTIPGMTDLSDLPAQANAMGIDFDTLVKIILNSSTIKNK